MADNLEGRTLRVGVAAPSSPGPYRGAIDYTSKVLKLLELLQSQLNFTFQLISLPDANDIGTRLENDSWNGLIGMLQRGELDVLATRVPILPLFRDVIDLSIPFGQDGWVTLQKQPSRWNSLSALLSPFEMEVWFLLLLSIVGMVPMMFIIYRLHLRFRPDSSDYNRGKLSDYVLFVVVSLLRQDHRLGISIHSQRVLMATWWIAGILLTTFYTANLTASLARPFRERSLQHPRELSWPTYKDIRWLMMKDAHTRGLVQDENTTGFAKMLGQDLQTGRGQLVDSIEVALNLTKRGYVWFGPFEMVLETLLADYRLVRADNKSNVDHCSVLLTDKSYLTVEYGLGFANNSFLTPYFDQALRLIDQSGILEHSRRPSFTGKSPCSIEGSYTARSMQLGDFLGLFCITIFGLSFATLIFAGENILFKSSEWWRKKKVSQTKTSSTPTAASAVGQAIKPEVTNNTQHELEMEIEKLTREINQMLLTDREIQEILLELLYIK